MFASSVSACAGEDVLRLLIWEGYAPDAYVNEFEKQIEEKYDRSVTLQVSYIAGPEDFYAPVRKKSVDVIAITHHHFKDERFKYIPGKLLLPIDTKNVPNLQAVIPALRDADYFLSKGKTFGVPVCQGPYGLAYNTAKVDRAPGSWRVLWDPAYKGKYVLAGNEYLYNVSMTALAWDYPIESIHTYDVLNSKKFREKLRQLAMNADSFWVGQDSADDLSGKSLAAVWGDSLGTLRKRGEIWKLAEPEEGSLCWIDNYAITWALADKPFLKKVAEEWINRLLEPDYQVDYIIREIGLGPVTTNIGDRLTNDERERLHIGTPNFFKNNRVLLPTCSRRDRNGLKLLWEEAMEGIEVEKGDDQ
jgi:spermidine/putrescine transport system substrate-binding protein